MSRYGFGIGRRKSWPILRDYPSIYVEGLKRNTRNISQIGWMLY